MVADRKYLSSIMAPNTAELAPTRARPMEGGLVICCTTIGPTLIWRRERAIKWTGSHT